MKNIFLFVFIIFSFQRAWAVSVIGNGAGVHQTEFNPWFVGDQPTQYCIDSPSSSDRSLVQKSIRDAIDDWKTTLEILKPEPILGIYETGLNRNLRVRFTEVSCAETHDLKFRIGKPTSQIQKFITNFGNSLFGIAIRTNYDDISRAKGIIWVKENLLPTQSSDARLYNTVLHELGHVFGFPHRVTGIMSEQHLVRLVLQDDGQKRMSSRSFAYANWFTNGIKVCGRPSERTESVWQQVFNTNVKREETRALCLQKVSENRLEVKLTTAQNIFSKSFFIADFQGQGGPFDEIIGDYKIRSMNGEFVYNPSWRHQFIVFGSPNVSANAKNLRLQIATNSFSNQISFYFSDATLSTNASIGF